jgi:hypothetical protein
MRDTGVTEDNIWILQRQQKKEAPFGVQKHTQQKQF